MNAWRKGPSMAKASAQATMRRTATTRLFVSPTKREAGPRWRSPRIRTSVRRRKDAAPSAREPAHDLGAGDDGRRQAGDAVGGRVAVELEQVRLHGVEGVDADASRERRGQHQPAHGRLRRPPSMEPRSDLPDRGHWADARLGREAEVVHEEEGGHEGHARAGPRGAGRARRGSSAGRRRRPAPSRSASPRRPRSGPREDRLEVAREAGRARAHRRARPRWRPRRT